MSSLLRRATAGITGALLAVALSSCSDGPVAPGGGRGTSDAAAETRSGDDLAATAGASVAPVPRWKPSGQGMVAWSDPTKVSHLFYHCLIVDPKRAFASKEATGYRDYMVTVTEFRRELAQLYAKGFVLVHPERLAAPGTHGAMKATPLMLPAGRTPLVLSVDDVNYYDYMTGDGFASNLFFTPAGHLANHYADAAGTTRIGSYDVAPIIDDFVRAHPDFSYDGDKGTLAETGYNGVLGYRTSLRTYGDTPTTRAAIATATAVATAIKADGWNFASHSWGHINFTKDSLAQITADTTRWDREVRPILGPTREFVFPFGADISGIAPYSEKNAKYHFLHDVEGYDYFFPIDATRRAWGQMNAGSLRQARINVDGISLTRALTKPHNVLWTFFDRTNALDPARHQAPGPPRPSDTEPAAEPTGSRRAAAADGGSVAKG